MAVPFTIDRIIPYKCIGIGNVTKLTTVIVEHEVMCTLLSRFIKVVTTVVPVILIIIPDAYRYMHEFILLIINIIFKVQK